jgi:membrane fusion protein, cation efflux system
VKPFLLISSILAVSLAVSAPNVVLAHVGHGDEFQSQGGVQRVKVNAETDSVLGIATTPIAQSDKSEAGVMIPITALIDTDGKKLVFVQYENFYEPVPVTTGATKGERIEVTQGLSVGEKLVTQGSLSLYAESRKTQTATESPSPDSAHAKADAQGIPHSHDAKGNLVQSGETTPQSSGFPMGILAAIGGGAALLVGAISFLGGSSKKKGASGDKKGGL